MPELRDPYDLVESLIRQNTEGLNEVKVNMERMSGGLSRLIETSTQARSEVSKLREGFDNLKDQHMLMYNHYFGADEMSGLANEHKTMKAKLDDWNSKIGLLLYFVTPTSVIALAVAIWNLFTKSPPPNMHAG